MSYFQKHALPLEMTTTRFFFQEGVWYDVAKFVPTIET
jgi:hypothetical protein